MLALKRLTTWQMNSKHSIKEAGQEVGYLADRVHQVGIHIRMFALFVILKKTQSIYYCIARDIAQ